MRKSELVLWCVVCVDCAVCRNLCVTFIFGFIQVEEKCLHEDVWFEAGSSEPGTLADHQPRLGPVRNQEAAGFARKLDNAEEDPLMALSLQPVLCSVVQIRRKIPPRQPTN